MQAFPGHTHDTYQDTPIVAIEWLTRVHALHKELENDNNREAAPDEGQRPPTIG